MAALANAIEKLKVEPNSLLAYMYKRGKSLEWGNVNRLSEGAFKEKGFVGAYDEAIRQSSRLPSEGMSNRMTRKERKEHYRRKAILETRKAKERRALWERRHPGAPEWNWEAREKKRAERKAGEREVMRLIRRRGSRNGSRSPK